MMKTVVAVTYGSSGSGGEIDCEVLSYPLEQGLSKNQLAPLVAASSPMAGELDEAMGLRARVDRLTELGGHYERVPASALVTAEHVSGGHRRSVSSEDYSEEIGQVLVFDAEVDEVTGSVDWSSAVPHPTVNPYDLGEDAWYQRADEIVIDGQALASRRHRVAVRPDGRQDTVNEFGVPVHGSTDRDLVESSRIDSSAMPVADMVVCTISDADGALRSVAQPLEVVQAMGGRLPDPRENGFRSTSDFHEMFVAAAGGNGRLVDQQGSPMWVGVVRAPHGQPQPAYGNNYPIVAQQAQLPVSPVDLSPSRDAQGRINVLKGAQAPSMSAMAGLVGPSVAPAASNDRQADRGPAVRRHEPSRRSRALAGMSSKVREAASKHGPQVAKAVRGALEDPVLRERLRTAGQLAVTAALATQGGGKAKLAAGLTHAARNPEVRGMAKQAGRAAVSKAAASKGYSVPGL